MDLGKYSAGVVKKEKKRITERGELLTYFMERINSDGGLNGKPVNIPYIAYKLTGIDTKDLYFIKSSADQFNGVWSKAFFGMLKIKKDD